MDKPSPLYKRLLHQTTSILAKWMRRTYERRQLSRLDGRELSDLGINHGDQMAELSKPFWRD